MRRIGWSIPFFILVAIGLLVLVFFPWSHNAWASYQNPVYAYSIEYPEDWELDDSDPSFVMLYSEEDYAFVRIEASEYHSLQAAVNLFLDNVVYHWDDVKILSNQQSEGKWDWIIAYSYTYDHHDVHAGAYFKETTNCTLVVSYDAVIVYEEIITPGPTREDYKIDSTKLCQDIVDTFRR